MGSVSGVIRTEDYEQARGEDKADASLPIITAKLGLPPEAPEALAVR